MYYYPHYVISQYQNGGNTVPYLKYIFLALLAAVSFIHLFVNHNRYITKPMLLPLVIAYYVTACSGAPSVILILAFVMSFFGDVFLMKSGNSFYVAGGISFMIAHFLFIAVYVLRIGAFSQKLLFAIPVALVYYAIAAAVIIKLRPTTPKNMVVPLYLYLFANGTMNAFAFASLLSNPCPATVAAYIGAIFFFISDCTLFTEDFGGGKKDRPFSIIMLTYIIGEFLIAHGSVI